MSQSIPVKPRTRSNNSIDPCQRSWQAGDCPIRIEQVGSFEVDMKTFFINRAWPMQIVAGNADYGRRDFALRIINHPGPTQIDCERTRLLKTLHPAHSAGRFP